MNQLFVYITAGTGQLEEILIAFVNESHAFPRISVVCLHAFFVSKKYEFGIHPPVKLQDATLKSSYQLNKM